MPHDIFISHSAKDSPIADAICQRLEQRQIPCWLAPRDVRPGYPYPGEIARAITGSKVMVLILSSASNISDHVIREVGLAADCRIHIVQFCIENVRPSDDLSYYLSLPHRVHAIDGPLESHLDSLEKAIVALLETWSHNRGSTPEVEAETARIDEAKKLESERTVREETDRAEEEKKLAQSKMPEMNAAYRRAPERMNATLEFLEEHDDPGKPPLLRRTEASQSPTISSPAIFAEQTQPTPNQDYGLVRESRDVIKSRQNLWPMISVGLIVLLLGGGLFGWYAVERTAEERNSPVAIDRNTGEINISGRGGSQTSGRTIPVPYPVDRLPKISEEELVILNGNTAKFTLTNIGGGVKYADLPYSNYDLEPQWLRVNLLGENPIGFIAKNYDSSEKTIWIYRPDESVPGSKAVYIVKLPSGIIAKKTFAITESKPNLNSLSVKIVVENTLQESVNLAAWNIFVGEASTAYEKHALSEAALFIMNRNRIRLIAANDDFFANNNKMLSVSEDYLVSEIGVANNFVVTTVRFRQPLALKTWAMRSQCPHPVTSQPILTVCGGFSWPLTSLNPGMQAELEFLIELAPKHESVVKELDLCFGVSPK